MFFLDIRVYKDISNEFFKPLFENIDSSFYFINKKIKAQIIWIKLSSKYRKSKTLSSKAGDSTCFSGIYHLNSRRVWGKPCITINKIIPPGCAWFMGHWTLPSPLSHLCLPNFSEKDTDSIEAKVHTRALNGFSNRKNVNKRWLDVLAWPATVTL